MKNSSAFKYNPMSFCSIKWLVDISSNTNISKTSFTPGGRTVNERPLTFSSKFGADIDISSSYGNELVKLHFPLGRPKSYQKTSNTFEKLTLGDFMKKNSSKFEKYKIYKIVISGNLSFE